MLKCTARNATCQEIKKNTVSPESGYAPRAATTVVAAQYIVCGSANTCKRREGEAMSQESRYDGAGRRSHEYQGKKVDDAVKKTRQLLMRVAGTALPSGMPQAMPMAH